MKDSELYKTGVAIRREILGEKRAKQNLVSFEHPAMREFFDLTIEAVFGTFWARPGLDLKTRALICVVSDAATGRSEVLSEHLRIALRHGWTEAELTEVLLHLMPYVGAPLTRGALLVATKVFGEPR